MPRSWRSEQGHAENSVFIGLGLSQLYVGKGSLLNCESSISWRYRKSGQSKTAAGQRRLWGKGVEEQ